MKIRLTTLIFTLFFIANLAIYIISPEVRGHEIQGLSLFTPITAALIGLYASRIYGFKSDYGRAILLITAGIACWAIAETVWYISDMFITSGTTSASPTDILFLLGYPFFGAGIYQGYITAGIKLKTVNRSLLAMVLSASIILIILVANFVLYKAYDSTADLTTNIVNICYGLGDLVLIILSLLAILVANEYRGGKLASFWKITTLSLFFMLIADIAFAIYGDLILEDVKPYSYIDLIFTLSYVLLAYGMLENYLHISAIQNKIRLKLQQRK